MSDTLETLQKIREINSSFPYTAPTKKFKEQGKKAIGWSCISVPEEIIHAAGMLPIRVTGGPEELTLDNANSYIYSGACSFMRSCFELGISNRFDFLDGYVSCTVCEGIIRLGELWDRYIKNIPVISMVGVPRNLTENGYEFYRSELQDFKQRLEQFAGRQISDQDLKNSIGVYNKTRELLNKIAALKKQDNPPVSGAETQDIVNAAVIMPREEYNQILEDLLAEIAQTDRKISADLRLMLAGSICSNPQLISGIESLGVNVVTDELCTGTRYFTDMVGTDPSISPLDAIAKRYFNIFPCGRTNPPSVRINRVLELAKEYRVDGVVTALLRSCPGTAYDEPLLKETLQENGIPVFELDVEYGTALTGPMRVRVEAFLETIGLLP